MKILSKVIVVWYVQTQTLMKAALRILFPSDYISGKA